MREATSAKRSVGIRDREFLAHNLPPPLRGEGRKPVRDATYAEVGFVRGQILAHITLKRNMRPSH